MYIPYYTLAAIHIGCMHIAYYEQWQCIQHTTSNIARSMLYAFLFSNSNAYIILRAIAIAMHIAYYEQYALYTTYVLIIDAALKRL